MPTAEVRALIDGMCPAAERAELGQKVAGLAGTLTITAANGQGTITVPADWGTDYVVLLQKVSGPDNLFTEVGRASGTATVYVIDNAGTAIDCSSTNAVLCYRITKV